MASLVAGQLIHLPGASHIQTFAVLIALYIPVGLMVGWMTGLLAVAAIARWKTVARSMISILLIITALLGFRQRMAVIDPTFALVNRPDEVAMQWIHENTPAEAVFLVNGFLIYEGLYAAGSDAGWWIPLLAHRRNTMPPQYALLSESEAIPGYGRAVVQLVADLSQNSPTTDRGIETICQFGATHVYIGQGQGKVAQAALTPYLDAAQLSVSPYYELLYHQDRVWIFALKDGVCS
jgi:hypothetical protein